MSTTTHNLFGHHIAEKNRLTFKCLSKLYALADLCEKTPLNQYPELTSNIKKSKKLIDQQIQSEKNILKNHPDGAALMQAREQAIYDDLNNIYDPTFRKILADTALPLEEGIQ